MPREKTLVRMLGEPLLIAVVLAFAVRGAVRIYSIPSRSMAPTLEAGDHIAVTPYRTDTPARGDVIVFRSPANGEVVVKRIVGFPGDLMDTRAGRLVVPAGCYFVVGDNRGDSHDSRHWGPLPAHLVLGRARLILWSGAPLGRIFKWIE
jgi:signal peptidase I